MKLPNIRLFRLLPFMSVISIFIGIVSCNPDKRRHIQDAEMTGITDSLRAGNMKSAIRMTEEWKQKSLKKGDSLSWSKAMVQQGINSYYAGDPGLLLSSTDSALNWLERQKPSDNLYGVLAKAYQTKGAYYDQYFFNPDSTVHYLKLAVNFVELSGNKTELPQTYGNYASAMRFRSSLDSAAIYYHKAITLADSLEMDTIHYIPLYNGIASVFTDMRDFDNSEIWWKRSMDILESMNQYDKFNTLTGYGNDLYYRHDYEGANKIFIELHELLDSNPEARWERMFTDVNLADTYIRLYQSEKASPLLDSAVNYFTQEQPNPVVQSYIHTLQIRDAIHRGDLRRGKEIAARNPVSDTLRLEQLLARLDVLQDLYSLDGDFPKAYATFVRKDNLNDSLRSNKLRQQISAQNALYQRDKKILNLKAGNTRQEARIYALLAIVAIVAIALVVIVGLVFFLFVRKTKAKRREDRMMAKIISLRQENLRNRITPHFIYNSLNYELNHTPTESASHLDALVHLIRRQQSALLEVLVPFSEELDFVNDYIKVIVANTDIPVDYRYSISENLAPDFPYPAMALQILVENAFKHGFTTLDSGETRRLFITVEETDNNRIRVTVFNNSGNKEVIPHSGGTGLRMLMETLRIINETNREKSEFSLNVDAQFEGYRGCAAVITLPKSLKA